MLTKPIKHELLYQTLLSVFTHNKKGISKRKIKPYQVADNLAQKYPLKILVAEDNIVNQKVVQRILERMGYRADLVANGCEAVEVLKKIPYEIIFMDMLMPEMDGITASKIIREECTGVCPKIIAMTANAMKEDKEKCLAAGLDDFIAKPIRMDDLQSILLHWGEIIHNKNGVSRISIGGEKTKVINESDILFVKDIASESDAAFFGELFDVYIKELPLLIKNITKAEEICDYKEMYFYAHKLKGSSVTLGIKPIAELCEKIESFAKENNSSGITSEFSRELVKIFEQVIEELEVIKEKYIKFPS